jgi:hypothetical protein
MSRRRTCRAAWWALVAVFLAQLATAAHACPLVEQALNPPAMSAEAEMPCADMAMPDPGTPSALCIEHCKGGDQAVDNLAPVAAIAALPPLPLVVEAFATARSFGSLPADSLLARATAPPVFASSSRLRI